MAKQQDKNIRNYSASYRNQQAKGKNFLFVIGIDAYQHCPKLFNAVKDAKDLVELLLSKYEFERNEEDGNIVELYNEKATRKNILKELNRFHDKVTAKDNLLIYFSGHGEFIRDEGYWIPIEAERGEDADYIANSVVKQKLGVLNCHHLFLMVDACFSGAIFTARSSKNKDIKRYERDPSRWGLTAGRTEIVSDGKPGDNSPFADSLLFRLKQNTGSIGVQELCYHVLEQVEANAKQTPIGEPLHIEGHKNGQFVFHLKKDEKADWAELLAAPSLAAYSAFLLKYPKGRYSEEAEKAIKRINAAELWEKIVGQKDNDLKALNSKLKLVNQYADKYEKEPHYDEALNVGEFLEYKKEFLLSQSSEFALRKFLRLRIPNMVEAEELRQEANDILNNKNKKEEEEKEKERIRKQDLEAKKIKEAERLALRREKERKAEKESKDKKERERERIAAMTPEVLPAVAAHKVLFDRYAKKAAIGLVAFMLLFFAGKFAINNFGKSQVTLPNDITKFEDTNGKFGYKIGERIVLASEYDAAAEFLNGKARVTKGEDTFIIDESGKCVELCPEVKTEKEAKDSSIMPQIAAEANYQKALDAANKDYKSKKYEGARRQYQVALDFASGFDFDIEKAKTGLENCNRELKKIADQSSQKEKQDNYNKWEKKGNTSFASGNYSAARDFYQSAADFINDATIKRKIKSCNTKITQEEEARRKRKAQDEEAKRNETNYQKYFAEGNTNYNNALYKSAKTAYEKAKSYKNTTEVQNKISDCNNQINKVPALSRILSDLENSLKRIPAGTFTMGCTSKQSDCGSDEKPTHEVTLNSFKISKFEVTQELWQEIMGSNPSNFKNCAKCPVERVSWNDIQDFIKKLNKKTGKNYRLPTEAEWEYAARGGQNYKYAGSNDIGKVAWYRNNSSSKTHTVGGRDPNGYGLYDMSGNVWEWCSDWYGDYSSSSQTNPKGAASSGSNRVDRGGSWYYNARYCRVSHRGNSAPSLSSSIIGFRLAHS